MAKSLSMLFMRGLAGSVLAMLICVTLPGYAQGMTDPTRPPVTSDTGDAGLSAEAVPELQSVLISPQRAEAIISGRAVKLGDKVGDARVTKITEDGVVLRNGKDMQVLKLFPNIEKRSGAGAPWVNVEKRPK